VDEGNEFIAFGYKQKGAEQLLASPAITNADIIASVPLHYKQRENWCNKFFACSPIRKTS